MNMEVATALIVLNTALIALIAVFAYLQSRKQIDCQERIDRARLEALREANGQHQRIMQSAFQIWTEAARQGSGWIEK